MSVWSQDRETEWPSGHSHSIIRSVAGAPEEATYVSPRTFDLCPAGRSEVIAVANS
jgi:hypothetical protein